MGAGSSFELPEPNTNPSTAVSSVSGNSSGYHSGCHSDLEDQDVNTSLLSKQAQSENRKMSKPPMRSRPSVIIGAITKQEQEREEELENRIVKKSPELKKVFEGFEACKRFLKDVSKRHEKFYESLNDLLQDKMIKTFNKYDKDEERMVMANRLARINFVEPLVDYYNFLYDDLDIDGINHGFIEEANSLKEKNNKEPQDHGMFLILTVREILWNYSDGSHTFSELVSKTNIFEKLVHDLAMILEDDLEDMKTYEDMDLFAFNSSVGILHNCARNPDVDKEKFRDLKVAEKLYPFLKSTVYVKMITLLALGNIVTEEEVSNLAADVDVIDFLLKAIVKALGEPDRKEHGFHLAELVDGLAAISQSDMNKAKVMAKKHLLSTLVKIIEGGVSTEILACVKLVWELAFLPENKDFIKKDKTLMSALDSLRKSSDFHIKKTANSAWFVLVDKDERIHVTDLKKSMKKAPAIPGTRSESKKAGKHIMFSYCWGDKETVLKIHQVIEEEGYPTWIDVKEMNKYANLLEGMAKAVEESFAILICFSEKYKNSQNCRTEADYAYARQKKIVPLKMQRGYKPDGWLGALIGAKLYIEFSPHYPFEAQMQQLRNQLKEAEEPPSPSPYPDTPKSKQVPVKQWTKEQIDCWISENKLEGSAFKHVKRMSGEQLEFLYKVLMKSPDTFYRWLETKVELKSLEDLMKFDRAIESLGKNVSY